MECISASIIPTAPNGSPGPVQQGLLADAGTLTLSVVTVSDKTKSAAQNAVQQPHVVLPFISTLLIMGEVLKPVLTPPI